MKFLSEKFKAERYKHCTQDELGARTGLSVETVRNIESGRKRITPTHKEYLKMCEAIKVNPNDFFTKDTKVLCFLSNKGGSTKTTTCANLAYSLATNHGKRILVIDTDLQQNLTQHFGMDTLPDRNFYVSFINNESIERHIRPTCYDHIDIVTGHDALSMLEMDMMKVEFREYRVREILEEIVAKSVYDYIMIDCNPSLNMLNTSILFATDGLIVPLNPTAFGKMGIEYIVNFYRSIEKRSERLHLLGVVVNKYDQRKKVPRDVVQLVKEQFGAARVLFNTVIPEDASVDKAQMMEEPLAVSFPQSRAALAFEEFAKEVIQRGKKIRSK